MGYEGYRFGSARARTFVLVLYLEKVFWLEGSAVVILRVAGLFPDWVLYVGGNLGMALAAIVAQFGLIFSVVAVCAFSFSVSCWTCSVSCATFSSSDLFRSASLSTLSAYLALSLSSTIMS